MKYKASIDLEDFYGYDYINVEFDINYTASDCIEIDSFRIKRITDINDVDIHVEDNVFNAIDEILNEKHSEFENIIAEHDYKYDEWLRDEENDRKFEENRCGF